MSDIIAVCMYTGMYCTFVSFHVGMYVVCMYECMYVMYICMYVMFVCTVCMYVYTVFMYVMYVQYVCMLCMYVCMYVCMVDGYFFNGTFLQLFRMRWRETAALAE